MINKKENIHDRELLFKFLMLWGPGYRGEDFCTFDNTGEYGKQKGEIHLNVFVKGGISFDISKELDDSNENKKTWQYDFISGWEGAYGCMTATDVISVLIMLGHGDAIEVTRKKIAAIEVVYT